MKFHAGNTRFSLKPLALGIALISTYGMAHAEELSDESGKNSAYSGGKSLSEADRLLEMAGDPNESSFMKDYGLTVGGWVNAGITYNSVSPENNFNGPVTFADRSGEFQLNQLNVFLERAVTDEDRFDVGGRFDIMFGTDAIFTQAYGVPAFDVNSGAVKNRSNWDLNLLNGEGNRFYDLAIPQAYLQFHLPVGNGLNVKAGHFYTPIGYETVPAPDNFFYTHAYTMQYGEPFTHTGFLGNYTIDDNWSVLGGVVTGSATGGWDGGWDKQLGNWAGIAGATWASTDTGTSLNVTGTYGGTSEQSSETWAMYSVVLQQKIDDKARFVVQHDHGYADGVRFLDANLNPFNESAEWYGINTHFYYDVTDTVTAGLRGEWFRDQNGFRVCSPGRVAAATDGTGSSYAASFAATCAAASYYAVTAGVTWKPYKWLNLRPNVRYDWADGARPFGDGGTYTGKLDQFLFSADMTLSF